MNRNAPPWPRHWLVVGFLMCAVGLIVLACCINLILFERAVLFPQPLPPQAQQQAPPKPAGP